MVSIRFNGLDQYTQLCKLTIKQTDRLLGRTIYPGGGVMYRYALQATQALPVEPEGFKHSGRRIGISRKQKEALIESLGIAPIRKEQWGMNVKIGFDGYNDIKTKRWPNGQPNMMVARSVNGGTTFLQPTYFMDKAVQRAIGEVTHAMEVQFNEELFDIWNK